MFLEHAPFPDYRFLGGLPRINSRSLTARIPCWQGKTQGISRNRPLFCEIRLQSNCKFNGLEMNSLRDSAGNYFPRAGNYFRLSTGAGNFAQNRSARHDASDRLKGPLTRRRKI